MSLPQTGRLMTIAEYAAIGDDDGRRWELLEGNLVMSPSPTPAHMIAVGELHAQLRTQVPADSRAVLDVDIDGVFVAAEPFAVRIDLDALT